jgi:hypothetical protein
MTFHRLSIVSIALFLAACPAPTSFVEYIVVLSAPPDITCVSRQLEEIAKRSAVQSFSDVTPTGINYRFNFEAGNAPHSIGIYFGDDGSFAFRNTAWAPNHRLRQLQEAQQSLTEVNEHLDGLCNLGRIVGNGEESCVGKNCDRLVARSE